MSYDRRNEYWYARIPKNESVQGSDYSWTLTAIALINLRLQWWTRDLCLSLPSPDLKFVRVLSVAFLTMLLLLEYIYRIFPIYYEAISAKRVIQHRIWLNLLYLHLASLYLGACSAYQIRTGSESVTWMHMQLPIGEVGVTLGCLIFSPVCGSWVMTATLTSNHWHSPDTSHMDTVQ